MNNKKLILFGAGRNGILALKRYGQNNIAFFGDNSIEKCGTKIEGIEVISFTRMIELYKQGYIIVITPLDNSYLRGQLEMEGIYDYLIFKNEEIISYIKNMEIVEEECDITNQILDKFVHETRKMDLIEDVSEFRKLSAEAIRKNKGGLPLVKTCFGEEGNFYGNMQALINYANLPNDATKYFPIVSHQDCFPLFTPAFKYKSAVVFSGEYYKKKVHNRTPYVPVFTVGPYIHYAKGIYNQNKIDQLRKKNGKTLLAFLPHSIETVSRLYDKRMFIDQLLALYSSEFNHILLCAYWADINDEACIYAAENGIQVVSAGFRFDDEFDCRLKTIIELSDTVVCGDIGTHIAYSLELGKPVGRIPISNNQKIADGEVRSELEKKLQFSDDHKIFVQEFYRIFDSKLKITNEQKKWMNPVCGFDQVKNQNYIKDIYEISKALWIESSGYLNKYPMAVRNVYHNFEKQQEFCKMQILKSAVGSYVD